jgi:hypothetical protein
VGPLAVAARHDPGCGGVLIVDVSETAVADQHDPGDFHLVAIGLGAPITANGAVLAVMGLAAAVGAGLFRPLGGSP